MPITTLQQLTDLMNAGSARRAHHCEINTGNTATLNGGWTRAKAFMTTETQGTPAFAGTNPGSVAGATVSRANAGALVVPGGAPSGSNKLYLARWMPTINAGRIRSPLLIDRLVHTSNLVGNITTAQTVNSVALPARATGGVGIEAAIEWYVATGSTAVTATVIFVDDTGTSRTVTMSFPASPAVGQLDIVPWPNGIQTRGIRSITSVQLSATTGTAGVFGFTLFRRLAGAVISDPPLPLDWRTVGLCEVSHDACLQMVNGIDTAGTITTTHEFTFVEA
jgi:hypothetical protein